MPKSDSSHRLVSQNNSHSRAHQRFLGVARNSLYSQHEPKKVKSVCLSDSFAAYFQAHSPFDTELTGPLFGYTRGHHRVVEYAACDDPPARRASTERIFNFNSDYILGWVDALRQSVSPEIDWIGHWLAVPDFFDQVNAALEVEQYMFRARQARLVDAYHVLIFVHFLPGLAVVPRVYDGVTRYVPVTKAPEQIILPPTRHISPSYKRVPAHV